MAQIGNTTVLPSMTLGTPLAQASGGTGGNYPVYRMLLSTPQTTNGAAFYDFLDVPSWCKRVTVMLNGVSTNGTSNKLIQIGDLGGIKNTGYLSSSAYIVNSSSNVLYTTGFGIQTFQAISTISGLMSLLTINTNVWVESHGISNYVDNHSVVGGGDKTLSGTLDRLRLTTVNGTDLFDGGTINCMYEGYL